MALSLRPRDFTLFAVSKRSQILDESPQVQNLKNTTNREQPGQNEATKLAALYRIYPDMKAAEDDSTRPQPSKKIKK